jgi:hypothetical protein
MDVFEVIRIYDPAVDAADSESILEYAQNRDVERLALEPAGAPVRYRCSRLTRSQYLDYVDRAETTSARAVRAFACGVVSIDGGGQNYNAERSATKKAISESELDAFDLADLIEIGSVILTRSLLPKNLSGGYQLPPTSLAALGVQMVARSLSAEPSPIVAAESSTQQEGA